MSAPGKATDLLPVLNFWRELPLLNCAVIFFVCKSNYKDSYLVVNFWNFSKNWLGIWGHFSILYLGFNCSVAYNPVSILVIMSESYLPGSVTCTALISCDPHSSPVRTVLLSRENSKTNSTLHDQLNSSVQVNEEDNFQCTSM